MFKSAALLPAFVRHEAKKSPSEAYQSIESYKSIQNLRQGHVSIMFSLLPLLAMKKCNRRQKAAGGRARAFFCVLFGNQLSRRREKGLSQGGGKEKGGVRVMTGRIFLETTSSFLAFVPLFCPSCVTICKQVPLKCQNQGLEQHWQKWRRPHFALTLAMKP